MAFFRIRIRIPSLFVEVIKKFRGEYRVYTHRITRNSSPIVIGCIFVPINLFVLRERRWSELIVPPYHVTVNGHVILTSVGKWALYNCIDVTLYRYRICDRLILNPSSSHAPKPIRINIGRKVRPSTTPPCLYHCPWNLSNWKFDFPSIFDRIEQEKYPWLIAWSGLPTPTTWRHPPNDIAQIASRCSSVATDRFVLINRNLLFSRPTGFPPSLPPYPRNNFIIPTRIRSVFDRDASGISRPISIILISARPTYASLPSLSA